MATRENAEALGNPKTVLWRAVLLEAGWQPLKHYFLNFLFQIPMSKSDRLSLVHKIGWQDKHSPVGQGHLRFLYSFVHLAGPCEEQIWSVLAKKVSRSRTNLQVFLRNSFFCSNNQSEYLTLPFGCAVTTVSIHFLPLQQDNILMRWLADCNLYNYLSAWRCAILQSSHSTVPWSRTALPFAAKIIVKENSTSS